MRLRSRNRPKIIAMAATQPMTIPAMAPVDIPELLLGSLAVPEALFESAAPYLAARLTVAGVIG